MDTECVDTILEEAHAAQAELAPIVEGLRDDAALNIQAPTKADVTTQTVVYDRRSNLLQAVIDTGEKHKSAINALLADGYPAQPILEVTATVAADLDAQIASLSAARKTFRAVASAVEARVVFSPPLKK